VGGGRPRVRKRRSSHPGRPLNRQRKRGAPTPLLVSPLEGGRDECSLGKHCCAFPNSFLPPDIIPAQAGTHARRTTAPPRTPAGRPDSCLRRNDEHRRAPIVLPYLQKNESATQCPTPRAPRTNLNKPEQIRTPQPPRPDRNPPKTPEKKESPNTPNTPSRNHLIQPLRLRRNDGGVRVGVSRRRGGLFA